MLICLARKSIEKVRLSASAVIALDTPGLVEIQLPLKRYSKYNFAQKTFCLMRKLSLSAADHALLPTREGAFLRIPLEESDAYGT